MKYHITNCVCEHSKQQLHQANMRKDAAVQTEINWSGEPASTLMLDNFIETMKLDDIMGPAVINVISFHYQ